MGRVKSKLFLQIRKLFIILFLMFGNIGEKKTNLDCVQISWNRRYNIQYYEQYIEIKQCPKIEA